MNIYGLQWDITWEEKGANFAKVRSLLRFAPPEPGSLIVLPEMFATGFSRNAAAIAEPPNGETADFLAATAQQYRCPILAGITTRDETETFRNEAVLYDATGAEIGRYAKMHPFTLGGETAVYTAGDAPQIFDLHGFRLTPFICYDLRFPEIFRAATQEGATFFVVIASWPHPRIAHWIALLIARAIENQAYVLGINRCGSDPEHRYSGQSLLVGPDGVVLEGAGNGEGVIHATVSPETVAAYRRMLPFLADRRF
jgi:omega-amidase